MHIKMMINTALLSLVGSLLFAGANVKLARTVLAPEWPPAGKVENCSVR